MEKPMDDFSIMLRENKRFVDVLEAILNNDNKVTDITVLGFTSDGNEWFVNYEYGRKGSSAPSDIGQACLTSDIISSIGHVIGWADRVEE